MRYLILGALASLGVVAAASAGEIVVPNRYANIDAPSDGLVILRGTTHHEQFQYAASGFGSTPVTLSAASFRYDQQVSDAFYPTIDFHFGSDFNIQIGTAAHAMTARSNAFADNFTGDVITVLSGAQTITMSVGGPAGALKSFGITFNFLTPFTYDPTRGDLVLDMFLPDIGLYADVDYVPDYDIAAPLLGVVFAGDHSATGGVYRGGPVTQFTTIPTPTGAVPEPGTWALLIAGFGMAGVMMRRWRAFGAT